uniref:Uncharacterized protein n=1 Tax=Timema genevievae TaxID=629358 RepID=A0A7R9JU82_TIMGE|nr:unnamed protein product [Timema genevievae]
MRRLYWLLHGEGIHPKCLCSGMNPRLLLFNTTTLAEGLLLLKRHVPPLAWRESGTPFRENLPQYTRLGSKHDFPVIGSLVYCDNSALDHAVTEADPNGSANGYTRVDLRKCIRICGEGKWKPIEEKNLSAPDLPFFGSLVYCESSALDHAAIDAGRMQVLIISIKSDSCQIRNALPLYIAFVMLALISNSKNSSGYVVKALDTKFEPNRTTSYYTFGLYAYVLITLVILGIRGRLYLEQVYLKLRGRRVENYFVKPPSVPSTCVKIPNLPVTDILVYCKTDALLTELTGPVITRVKTFLRRLKEGSSFCSGNPVISTLFDEVAIATTQQLLPPDPFQHPLGSTLNLSRVCDLIPELGVDKYPLQVLRGGRQVSPAGSERG